MYNPMAKMNGIWSTIPVTPERIGFQTLVSIYGATKMIVFSMPLFDSTLAPKT